MTRPSLRMLFCSVVAIVSCGAALTYALRGGDVEVLACAAIGALALSGAGGD